MVPDAETHVGLFAGLPVVMLMLTMLAASALWIVAHAAGRRRGGGFGPWRTALAGGVSGWMALASGLELLGMRLTYTAGWPTGLTAALGAAAVEASLALYGLERRKVSRPLTRRLLAVCRVLLALTLIFMLNQPVLVTERTRTVDRMVAVVLDESASMDIADSRLREGERLRLAEALGLVPDDLRPHRLDAAPDLLAASRDRLAAQEEWLGALQGLEEEARAEQLEAERKRLNRFFRETSDDLRPVLGILNEARTGAADVNGPKDQLGTLETRLDETVVAPLTDLAQKTRPESMPERWMRFFRERAGLRAEREETNRVERVENDPGDAPPEIAMAGLYDQARRQLSTAVETLKAMEGDLKSAANDLDDACYRALDEPTRETVDQVTRWPRAFLAQRLLAGPPKASRNGKTADGMLESLLKTHPVRFYRLADRIERTDPRRWLKRIADLPDPDLAAKPDGEEATADVERVFLDRIARERELTGRGLTDVRMALEQVIRDIAPEQLEAVILVGDMRHSANGNPEDPASKLAQGKIPVHVIPVGAEQAPVDAAIVSVEAPDTVLFGDRVRVLAEVRMDGLSRRTFGVRLIRNGEIVHDRPVRSLKEGERLKVELVDKPEKPGIQHYRVAVDFEISEAVATNNLKTVSVNVAESPNPLLLIEGRPSWEFRYLKNLFSGRDPWTRLQYVLLEPHRIPGEPEREIIPAAVTRAASETEATALPASLDEWLKFDVVILGDVAPERLPEEAREALKVFVTERGGALIVLAGPYAMPHAYADPRFRELLPVHTLQTDRALMLGPEREFRIRLTADGQADPIMRLSADPDENLALWAAMPPMYWRQPAIRVRDGATVLAYAEPPDVPAFMFDERLDAEILARQRDYERAQALITRHHAGLGSVLMLGFNHTWRLRYRTGDTFHHRFWGQIMRWATTYKLPFGTTQVRLDPGKAQYTPGETVRLRARLLNADHSPLVSDRAVITLRHGDEPLARHALRYVEGTPGIYETEITGLGPGAYVVGIEAPLDADVIKAFQDSVAEAPPEFVVASAVAAEWADLTPDRGLAGRLAAITGGSVTEPFAAASVLDRLGPPRIQRVERRQWDVWNSWILLMVIGLLAGLEWILRKRERLP